MERKPYSTGSIVGAVVLLVVVLLGLYVGGYFALGTYELGLITGRKAIARDYRYDWLAYVYRPVARVEDVVTGKLVVLRGPGWFYYSDGTTWDILSDVVWPG